MLQFDPQAGFSTPSTAEIRQSVQEDWQAAFQQNDGTPLNVDAETPAGQLVDAETAEIAAKNAELLWLASQFNPRTAQGRFQEALGYIYFLTRKRAQPTVVTCQITGLPGTLIPYGAIAQTSDGVQVICNAPVTIGTDSTAETTFRTGTTGPVEIAAGSVTQIITVTPGWDTINNEAAGATGNDVETQQAFEARRYASVAANAHGTVDALYGTIGQLSGVLDLQVLENAGPDPATLYGFEVAGHSVAVCVYGGEDADIAQAIYQKKDCGCGTSGNHAVTYTAKSGATYTYQIVRPETETFSVQVAIPGASSLSESVQQAIQQAVVNDFLGQGENNRVGLASTVYASRFYPAVLAVEGVTQMTGIEISLGSGGFSDSVTIDADVEPVMTKADVTIVEG